MALTPYSGVWDRETAAHLLRRATFGPNKTQIANATAAGLTATLDSLFTIPILAPPLTFDVDETVASQGATWVNSVYPAGPKQACENARGASLRGWMVEDLRNNTVTIQQKMWLFWQNHYANVPNNDSRSGYTYHNLMRQFALGDFKEFTKQMTINPSMLIFLNGASNNVYSPNENFARELLELFTVAKGPQVGPGDYTTYTETDVSESSRILTGWTVDGYWSETLPDIIATFEPGLHDTTPKTLGSAFGGATILSNGAQEYADYIDLIFSSNTSQSIAKFICKKLYRYFVNYDVTTTVQNDVINAMAAQLIADNYVLANTVRALLGSEHFYDIQFRGCSIKNPAEFVMSILNTCNVNPTLSLVDKYDLNNNIFWSMSNLGMMLTEPPNVGGWFAYYQAPAFSRLWANSSYLTNRFNYSSWLGNWDGYDINGTMVHVDRFALIASLSVPNDPQVVINELCELFYPKQISVTRKTALKGILVGGVGMPDFEWTIQYDDYLANIADPVFIVPVENRIRQLLGKMFRFPEFQLH